MTELKPVDLFVEGRLGQWILDQVEIDDIGTVWSVDQGTTRYADSKGFCGKLLQSEWPDIVTAKVMLNVHGQKIFPKDFLGKYQFAYNIHPAYLPFGKGQNSAFWALWNNEPAGASLHQLDQGIDTGPVIDRLQVKYDDTTFLGELLQEIEQAQKTIFLENWSKIRTGGEMPKIYIEAEGTSYRHNAYVELVTNLRKNWRDLTSEELIRVLRCLHAFPLELGERIVLISARPNS